MPVQAQLGSPRRIAAHFQEQRPEIGVVDVEVVMVHVDGLVPRELELPIDLLALKCLRLLLCDADKDDAIVDQRGGMRIDAGPRRNPPNSSLRHRRISPGAPPRFSESIRITASKPSRCMGKSSAGIRTPATAVRTDGKSRNQPLSRPDEPVHGFYRTTVEARQRGCLIRHAFGFSEPAMAYAPFVLAGQALPCLTPLPQLSIPHNGNPFIHSGRTMLCANQAHPFAGQ